MSRYIKMHRTLQGVFYPTSKDDPLIDALRGISILMILLFHCFMGVGILLKDPIRIQAYIDSIPPFLSFVFASEKAVDIFFVISGYLLSFSLFKELNQKGVIAHRHFYLKRFFRLYPLFIVALILYAPVNIDRSFKNLFYNLFFIDNFFGKSIIPVGWSLSIELQFCVILPALVYLIQKSNKPLLVTTLLLGLSFLARYLICLAYPQLIEAKHYSFTTREIDPQLFTETIYYPTHGRFGPLIIGILWALLQLQGFRFKFTDSLIGNCAKACLLLAAITTMITLLHFPVYQTHALYYQNFNLTLNTILVVTHRNLFCLGLLVVLLFFQGHSQTSLPLVSNLFAKFARVLRPFSQLVFPMYLFHFPMIAIAGVLVFQTTDPKQVGVISLWQVFLIYLVAIALTFLFALLMHLLVEKPMIRFGYQLAARYQKHPQPHTLVFSQE